MQVGSTTTDSLKNLPHPVPRGSPNFLALAETRLPNPKKLFRFVASRPSGRCWHWRWVLFFHPVVLPMTSTSLSLADRLQTAIDLAQSLEHHHDAQKAFTELLEDLQGQNPIVVSLLQHLWQEYLSSQRSALFWEQLSTVEKKLSDQLTESHLQLKQNYLRLVQEQ